MTQGYLCLVLHAHLPFVRHPEHADFLEEDWFYEGMTETYLPLLDVFERLSSEGIRFPMILPCAPVSTALAPGQGDSKVPHRARGSVCPECVEG